MNPATENIENIENTAPHTSSRNRRKRSKARKGVKRTAQDTLQPPGTAPAPRNPPTSKDIDALVERVRAVAMAENRPSTPGSHIDWAGEDDDSLPDLDDWGISTADSKAPVISPIIINGLKTLPELTSSVALSSPTTTQATSEGRAEQRCEQGKAQELKTSANHALGGLAQSIHAPPVACAEPSFTTSPGDSISTPTQVNVQRHRQRRNHTAGRPFNRNGRGASHGPTSPPTSTHRSRPILTNNAISRLARAVGNTTTPSSKATPIAND